MSRTSTLEAANQLTKGEVGKWILKLREEGNSPETIAYRLRETYGLITSRATIYRYLDAQKSS